MADIEIFQQHVDTFQEHILSDVRFLQLDIYDKWDSFYKFHCQWNLNTFLFHKKSVNLPNPDKMNQLDILYLQTNREYSNDLRDMENRNWYLFRTGMF